MFTSVQAGDLRVRGVSLGGVYTSLYIPELGALFDAGTPLRSAAGCDHILLSHAHADHIGALPALLGIRGLHGKTKPPRLYMPKEVEADVLEALAAMTRLQRYDLGVEAIALSPGDEVSMRGDLFIQAFQTHHVVPSLGYSISRRIKKLRPEFFQLKGPEIAERKRAGENLFRIETRNEISYATDTHIQVLDNCPDLYKSRVLVLECTFLDEKKSRKSARAGCHIHLDEIIERAHLFENQHIVLMHFSQLYKPAEIPEILKKRCPDKLLAKIIPFIPKSRTWGA